jgi:conjugative transfer signal peptidase TraF
VTDYRRGISLRRRGKSRSRILTITCAGLCLVALSLPGRHAPFVIYNASASAPIGFYRVLDAPIRRGDLILVQAPETVRRLAAERGYLPQSVPLVKRVAALGGDAVCVRNRAIFIESRRVADRLAKDGQGRFLPAWAGCRTLGSGEFFLLMEDVPDSFDSRYFGPVQASAIVGRLTPIWTG